MNHEVHLQKRHQKATEPSKRKEKIEFAESHHQKAQNEEFPFPLQMQLAETPEKVLKAEKERSQLQSKSLGPEKISQVVDLDDELVQYGKNSLPKSQEETKVNDASETSHLSKIISQGKTQDNESDVVYSRILAKLRQYKERVLSNKKTERELSLFIKVLTGSDSANHCDHNRKKSSNHDTKIDEERNCGCEFEELAYDIRKNFLDCEISKSPNIFLLTGVAGSGKSIFCKHLQRELLSDWSEFQIQVSNHKESWFPIYMELSRLKNPKSKVISETLAHELALTDEEILILTASRQSEAHLPRLLFLFNGYDDIANIHSLSESFNRNRYLKNNNFWVLINEAIWKNAKFIITCREESLQSMQRRDLIFTSINAGSTEPSKAFEPLMQRRIELFSDEQITCYLKKSHILKQNLKTTLASQSSNSWSLVEKFEKLIDEYGLREIARVPFMLKIIVDVLPDIVSYETQGADLDSTLPRRSKMLTSFFLMEYFVNKIVELAAREENKKEEEKNQQQEHHLAEKIKLRLQSLALKLSNYSEGNTVSVTATENEYLLLLCPLVEWDSKLSKVRFICNMLQDFFVAKFIEEEIINSSARLKDESVEMLEKMRFNQRPLANQLILYLRDSVRDQRLKPTHLMAFVMLSRQNEAHHQRNSEKIQGYADHSDSHSPLAVAAANAITILNSYGYDFSGQDVSSICIPGANLSYGIFEGTDFTNANLKGVEFTTAWLKDANFVNANLSNVEFGEIPNLKLKKKKIRPIAYSGNGIYLALEIGGNRNEKETAIFEKSWVQGSSLKEIQRVPGSFLLCNGDCFSKDSQQVHTVMRDEKTQMVSICTWDISTGIRREKFDVSLRNVEFLHFDSGKKQFIVSDGFRIQKYNITSKVPTQISFEISRKVPGCDVSSEFQVGLVGDSQNNTIIFSLLSGNSVLKQHLAGAASCKFSPDGTQFVTGISQGGACISDSIRGHIMKSLKVRTSHFWLAGRETSFTFDRKHILISTGIQLNFQDVTGSNSIQLNGEAYALNPDGKEIALSTDQHTVSFKSLTLTPKSLSQTMTIRGNHDQGLNLKGSIVNSSVGLSEQNILLFQKKGDYDLFDQAMIEKLFLAKSEDAESIREIALTAKGLSPIHAKIIGNDLRWINLQTLDLSQNDIGEDGGQVIGYNKTWVNLEVMVLENTKIGDQTITAIAKNQTWNNLKRLELAMNNIGDIGATAIGKSQEWPKLEALSLRNNEIGDEGAIIIGENSFWTDLTKLDLSGNKIGKRGLHVICSNDAWENLTIILLHENPAHLQENDILKIVEGIPSTQLIRLYLPQAKFDQYLLQCFKYDNPKEVVEISRSDKKYTRTNAFIIGSNTTWTNLRKLNVSKNAIGDLGGVKIGSNNFWINLEELDLSEASLEVDSGIAIGENTTWKKLRVLNLNGNKIGIKGACSIGANTTWTNLQVLDLGYNEIGQTGARELSKNTIWKNLQKLDLYLNIIGNEGARELSKNATWENLKTLNLAYNKIGEEGARELRKNTTWKNLQKINFR